MGIATVSGLGEAIKGVQQLEKLNAEWLTSTRKIEGIWQSFRLLPLETAYLCASHYKQSQTFTWVFTKKWDMYVEFDKDLHEGNNIDKISAAFSSVLKIQKHIVALYQIALAQPGQEQDTLFQQLKLMTPELYRGLQHASWIAKGSPPDQFSAKIVLSQEPGVQLLVLKMLKFYKDGYLTLDTFFSSVRR